MTDIEFFCQGIDGWRYADDDGRSAPPGMSTDEVADTGRDVSPSADDGRPGMTGSWVRMDHFYWPAPQAGPPAPSTPGGGHPARAVAPGAEVGRRGWRGGWVRLQHFTGPAPPPGPPAPSTPGGAPRVGGHAQGRGHEQQQSAALSL